MEGFSNLVCLQTKFSTGSGMLEPIISLLVGKGRSVSIFFPITSLSQLLYFFICFEPQNKLIIFIFLRRKFLRNCIFPLAAFNLFENKEAKFRYTITVSRISSRRRWWYTGCQRCHRVAKPARSAYADPRTYTCSDRFCPSTAANVVYCLSVIASDQTGEAESTLFGRLAEQLIGCPIHRVIADNPPTQSPIL